MLDLDTDDEAPLKFIRTMYDLIYLAFRTDSTRVATKDQVLVATFARTWDGA